MIRYYIPLTKKILCSDKIFVNFTVLLLTQRKYSFIKATEEKI